MDLLVDTQTLVFVAQASPKLTRLANEALQDPTTRIWISSVVAWEYAELNQRGRFAADLPLNPLLDQLSAVVIDFPADAWRLADTLPNLHRDPVDRMLVAHALHLGFTLVTADATIRDYPVRTLW